jgi:hypothetical protein
LYFFFIRVHPCSSVAKSFVFFLVRSQHHDIYIRHRINIQPPPINILRPVVLLSWRLEGNNLSSLRRILASRANGRSARGPVTPAGKRRSSQNAVTHGLLSRHIVLENESPEAFEALLTQHLDRLQPADGLEYGMVEEMVVAHWRMRRLWATETRMLQNATPSTADSPSPDPIDRMAQAFSDISTSPSIALMQRYEARMHMGYQRALHNLLLLRALELPNEPSPISEHPEIVDAKQTP